MTVSITLKPSGHVFEAQKSETILEAALRAGVALNYNCNNGSCGQCLSNLVEGRLGEQLPHDFVIKNHANNVTPFLLCRTRPASDLVIEAHEAKSPGDVEEQIIETMVHKKEFVADNICILQLRTPRSRTLRFFAGQHVRLQLGTQESRSKSIGSCPCNGRYLQFHVRRVPGDAFSEYVFETLQPREKVVVQGPYGQFTLDDDSGRPIIFVAFDTGFSPIKSLIEHAIALEKSQEMYFYWIVGKTDSHYLENYCRAWVDALDNFHYIPVSCDCINDHADLPEKLTVLGSQVIMNYVEISGYDFYINGPPTVFEGFRSELLSAGVPAERIFIDSMKRY
jgi:CDP-4-dehydro-6-deoxyglucose reductase